MKRKGETNYEKKCKIIIDVCGGSIADCGWRNSDICR